MLPTKAPPIHSPQLHSTAARISPHFAGRWPSFDDFVFLSNRYEYLCLALSIGQKIIAICRGVSQPYASNPTTGRLGATRMLVPLMPILGRERAHDGAARLPSAFLFLPGHLSATPIVKSRPTLAHHNGRRSGGPTTTLFSLCSVQMLCAMYRRAYHHEVSHLQATKGCLLLRCPASHLAALPRCRAPEWPKNPLLGPQSFHRSLDVDGLGQKTAAVFAAKSVHALTH
jgi:hypothetical protein